LVVLVACKSSSFTYRGKTSEEKSRIALQNGSHKSVWKTNDVSAQYSYTCNANNFQISGQVNLGAGLKAASDIVQSFIFRLNFLNVDGKVLDNKVLAEAGFREPITTWQYDKNFKLPTGTTAIAFSYQGQMGVDKGGGNASAEFWHDPFQ
jgi:hypothetical protein